jgi:GNAT superfamily N-acetyltransferase
MIAVRFIPPGEPLPQPGLSDLLADAVHGGASVGFLAPLAPGTAAAYWHDVAASLGPGLLLWVAEDGDEVVGAVQLAPALRENGLHRAEVCKLFVRRTHRGRGVASRLMQTLEAAAREAGRTLLVLDTQAGSDAENVYRHLGWQKAGEIPAYARSPDGALHATALYFKRI